MNPIPLWARLLMPVLALVVLWGVVHAYNGWQQGIGEARVRAEWVEADKVRAEEALAESQGKARETLRRIEAQERNQRAKDEELVAARAAAARNAADADRVREQSAGAAREWAARLADSPSAGELQAAAAAIDLLTNVRGRLDQAAGDLAAYAGASRAAGIKCERDYDALTSPR